MRAHILQSLAGSQAAEDVAAAALGRMDPAIARQLFPDALIPAAVLVPVVEYPDGLRLLLTQRTAHLREHPGQISFPGGRVEPDDRDAVHTALREAAEEIGLASNQIEVAGVLPPHAVVTGFAVTPVVGLINSPLSLQLDDFEVAEAFEVPLDFLRDPRHQQQHQRVVRGVELRMVEYHYGQRRIWGATAQMIDSFLKIL